MTVRSTTATLDATWDSILEETATPAPAADHAEALADILYFHEQGLIDDAVAMFEALRRRHPDDPSLDFAPWERASLSSHPIAIVEQEDLEDDDGLPWDADERDILEALDMLDGYDESRDASLTLVPDADPHEAITVVDEVAVPAPTAISGSLDYPVVLPSASGTAPTDILVELQDDELAADWFDDAVAALATLERLDEETIDPRQWELDFNADEDEDVIEVEIDTAEFDAPAPGVVQTLTYLPRDLEDMRARALACAGGSVHDTMPYSDHDRPRPWTVISGGR